MSLPSTKPTNTGGDRYGGRDPDQVAFYHTSAWIKCRDAYIKSVGGMCERCMARGIYHPGYIVHHRTHLCPENVHDPNYLLSWDNLEYLCQECHNLEHFGKGEPKRYRVNDNGEVILLG
jgi:hypothetical protein